MKRILLTLFSGLLGIVSFAQVSFVITNPASVSGSYQFTYSDPAGGWGSPDLTIPANSVLDTLAFADDGTAADSLACNALINGSLINGKIAVIYRGTCQFGTKALNAQNAGAVAVILINNVPGGPIGMAPGNDGANVTIPVVMISDVDGAALRSNILAGNTIAFIGNKQGYFANDVGSFRKDLLMSEQTAIPQLIAQNNSEFSVPLGAWVRNFGSNNQSNVTLSATISRNGNSLYTQTSTVTSINSADSAYITLPTFSQTTYPTGYYKLTYTISLGGPDDDAGDNSFSADFSITNDLFAYSGLDSLSYEPLSPAGYRPGGTFTGTWEHCIVFRNPNASRLTADGINFSFTSGQTDSLTGKAVEVVAYLWEDKFTDLNTASTIFDTLTQIESGFFTYFSNQNDVLMYQPFGSPLPLINNQRYLFCVRSFDAGMFLGYDVNLNYTTNVDTYLQPVFPINTNAWAALGFGNDIVPAFSVKMSQAVGIKEDLLSDNGKPYPNPAMDYIRIPVKGIVGSANLSIYDVSGKLVKEEVLALTNNETVKVNLEGLNTGVYTFKLMLNDGKYTSFKVSVNK